MKIYQINVVCGSGSTGRIAVDLAHTIEKKGHACRIAYGRGQVPMNVDAVKISNRLDLYWHALMSRLTGKHGLYSGCATRKLIKDIQQYQPDIIHLHNIHGYYVNYNLLFHFLKEYGKPIVWTMHDCWAFTGHCAHYESVGCNQWKTLCRRCTNLRAYPKAFSGFSVTDNFKRKENCFSTVENMTIVTPSFWLKQQIEESFLKHRPCVTIPNGINLSIFRPLESDLRKRLNFEGKKVLLGVANVWTAKKGFDDFIRLRKMLEERYVICMIGLSQSQIDKLPEGMIGVAKTDSVEELAQYYSMADVLLNLTYEDTFPTTNIEAIACGTPVITYRTGGSPEILDESCGAVAKAGNLQEVVYLLERWLRSKNDYRQACLDRAQEFEKDHCYEKYMELYQSIQRGVK